MARNSTVVLKDMEGKDISKSNTLRTKDIETLHEGETLTFSGKEVEIMGVVSEEDWATGKCFRGSASASSIGGGATGTGDNEYMYMTGCWTVSRDTR